MSSLKKKRVRPQWWERNIDRYFRALEGRQDRCRDPKDLQKEMQDDASKMVEEREAYSERWQQDRDAVSDRMSKSLSGDAPLWMPLPTWQNWKRKEMARRRRRARFEKDTRLVDGRVVRGGLIPGGGRVYMTMEERKRRAEKSAYRTRQERQKLGGSTYMTMEERKSLPSVYTTMEERKKGRGKSSFMTMEEKLAALERKTGLNRRMEVIEEPISRGRARARRRISALENVPDKKPPFGGWVPKLAGKLGDKSVNEQWEAGYREACREALFTGWERVGRTLGKVKGRTMYE